MKKGPVSKDNAVFKLDRRSVCGVAVKNEKPNATVNWGENNWALDCDFNGNGLSNVQVPADQCGRQCEDKKECTHFVWTKRNNGTCWMKKGPISKDKAVFKPNQGMVCGVAVKNEKPNATVNWGKNNWAPNCNFPGNDLSNIQVPASQCGPQCEAMKECTHFVWTNDNEGTCWMKKGPISKDKAVIKPAQGVVCGVAVKNENPNGIIWREHDWALDCDFIGNDLSNVEVPASKCGPECEDIKECTHFVWTNENDGTCWLKKGPISKDKAVFKPHQGMVCGLA